MLKSVLKRYYHKHMDNKVLQKMVANYYKIKRSNQIIRVLFICQMPQLWNKVSDVYNEMTQDAKIETYILIVPDVSVAEEVQGESIHFFEKIKGKIIDARVEGGWYNIEDIRPDYVFYQRPYDQYLPEEYKSASVARYARICYVPYAYACTKPVENCCYNLEFFTHIYMFFAENEYSRKLIEEREKGLYARGIKKAYYFGYPALDSIRRSKGLQGHFWEKNDKSYKILWCPRWTTAPELGASHFFEYKDFLVDWTKKSNNSSMVFRPHPMMFSNFEKTGEMSVIEAEHYLENYTNSKKLMYDDQSEYYTTLWNSDLLIADLTTVIIEYFVTRKPIIFCISEIEYNDFMREIIKGCYCVNNQNELLKTLEMLKRGEDPLREERNRIAEGLLKDKGNVACLIVKEIKRDFYSGE